MTPEQAAHARVVFAAALKREAHARGAFVDEACRGDAELRKRVDDLLLAHEQMGRFFEHGERESEIEGSDSTATLVQAPDLAPKQAQLYAGERLGDRFVVVQFLAAGGMGEVYEVIDEHLQGKHFALKTLRPEIAADPEMRGRFEREVIIAGEVNHTNVCPTYNLFHLSGPRGPIMCLTMRLIRGESLAVRLRRLGRMPLAAALPIIRQMAAGLDAAHAAGVVHRDFKPGNVMLEFPAQQPHVWITDFGVSRIFDSDHTVSPIGQISGTRGYIAPDVLHGRSASPSSDVYALGVVIYEMLTGRQPIEGANAGVIAPSTFAADIPPVWDRIVLGCLEPDPGKRFATAGEALALLDSRPHDSASSSAETKQGHDAGRRTHLWRNAAVILFAVGVILAGWRVMPMVSRFASTTEPHKTSHDWLETGKSYLQHRDRKGSVDSAIQALRLAVAADGQNAAAWAELAETYVYQNQMSPDAVSLNLARTSAARAVELNPYLAAGHTALAEAELAAGRPESAFQEIRRALEVNPRDAAANMALGDASARQQNNKEAEEAYGRGVELAKNDWYLNTRFGMFLQARGRYAEAAATYERAREFDPDNAVVNRNLGATYFKLERFDEAASAFQRALATNPSAILYTNLGTLFFYQGLYKNAVDAFERAVALDANRYRIWGNLADAYRWTPGSEAKAPEAYEQAIRLVRDAIAKAPADVNLTSQLATFLAKTGKRQEALKELASVHIEQPSQILVRAAVVEELCGNRSRALGWLRLAIHAGYSIKELNSEPEFIELRRDPEYHRLLPASTR